MEKFKLSNGVEIPSVGIGTFLLTPDQGKIRCMPRSKTVTALWTPPMPM